MAQALATAMPPPAANRQQLGPGRWLTPAELSCMFGALMAAQDRDAANALRLMLLTGVSADEARTARRDDLDLSARAWLNPTCAGSIVGLGDIKGLEHVHFRLVHSLNS